LSGTRASFLIHGKSPLLVVWCDPLRVHPAAYLSAASEINVSNSSSGGEGL
jgi:hypothetical protein